jgi:hypothetical protein
MPDMPCSYDRAPVWAQSRACTAVGARTNHGPYGYGFGRRLAAAIERSSWPEAQVLAYRDARLRRIVRLATAATVSGGIRLHDGWVDAPSRH